MNYVQVGAVWIHTLAMIMVIGYYGVLGRVILPGLRRSLDGARQCSVLVALERRALPLVVGSIVLFAISGAYLLVVDEQYAGLGNFLGSTWTALMLVKHLLVGFMVVLGVLIDRLVRRLAEADDDGDRQELLAFVGLATEGVTGLGAGVVLLTAAAQLS